MSDFKVMAEIAEHDSLDIPAIAVVETGGLVFADKYWIDIKTGEMPVPYLTIEEAEIFAYRLLQAVSVAKALP